MLGSRGTAFTQGRKLAPSIDFVHVDHIAPGYKPPSAALPGLHARHQKITLAVDGVEC
jgi:hypothetical protein